MRLNAILGARAVLFDFDDTLVNSDLGRRSAHNAVGRKLRALLIREGLDVPLSRLIHFISEMDQEMDQAGRFVRDRWWPDFSRRFGGVRIARKHAAMLTDAYWRAWMRKSPPYSDAAPTLAYLKHLSYKLGMVTDTDGQRGLKRRRICQSDLNKYFDAIVVAGEDCPQQKPKKEPFLMIAKKLRVPPRNCVMVGDKISKDIDGALRAGMKTILVRRERTVASPKTIYVVRRLSDLRSLLSQGGLVPKN